MRLTGTMQSMHRMLLVVGKIWRTSGTACKEAGKVGMSFIDGTFR